MRILIWIIVLAVLAAAATFIADLNTGYAIFIAPPYRMEMSLNFFIISLVVLVIVLFILFKLLVGILAMPGAVRRWRERRKQNAARLQGYQAQIAMYEGRMQRVERSVNKALENEKSDEARTVALLTGAKAAHVMREYDKRDEYLKQISDEPKLNLAGAMLKAEMFFEQRRYREALDVLAEVRKASPKLISGMRLELKVQQREGNALRVIELADKLEKLAVFDHEQAERIRHEAYLHRLKQPMTLKELKDWWGKLPAAAKKNPMLVQGAVKALLGHDDPKGAATVIEQCLDQYWDMTLLDSYGRLGLKGSDLTAQLQKAEQWLKAHSHDAELLLTLGRLCSASELWGKAQSYYEASLSIKASATVHAELGYLLEQLERPEEANQHYRKALELKVGKKP